MNDHIVISVGAAAVAATVATCVAAATVGADVAGISVAVAGCAHAAKVESKKLKTTRIDKNLTFFIMWNSFSEN
jgi:hypothetical protein